MRLVLRAGRRALARHPVQLLLAVLGVAVGVAVVVAVDLANQSARQAMQSAIDRVAGRATHQVVAGPAGVPRSVYVKLRRELGIRRAAPIIELGVTLPGHQERSLTLLGVDPFAEAPFRGYLQAAGAGGAGGDLAPLLAGQRRIVLPSQVARQLGVGAGDMLRLLAAGQQRSVVVDRVVSVAGRDLAGLAFADLATIDGLRGPGAGLSRIDLMLKPGQVGKVRAALPAGTSLVPARARGNALVQMSDAFQVNLTALSLLALVVGLFLVFNTMSFLVVQRRALLGTLRAIGATRGQITLQVLADAAVIGALGTLIGLPLGWLLATGLTEMVLRTINDLYLQTAGGLELQALSLVKGLGLGVLGTLLAALPAAREAASVPPRRALTRSDLERQARRVAWLMAAAGSALLVLGGILVAFSSGLTAGFGGLFAVLVGSALLLPVAVLGLGRLARLLPGGGVAWRLAVNGAVASLSRTGVAVASLAVAVAAVIGVAVMIDSFRSSVADWLERTLQADYYVSASGGLPEDALTRLANSEGVAFVTRSRTTRLPTANGYVRVWGLQIPRRAWSGIDVRQGGQARSWRGFQNGRNVLVSEPFAYERDLAVGDELRLPAAEGDKAFSVAGIFRDYGAVSGVVLMRRALYSRLWRDDRVDSAGVYLRDGVSPGRAEPALQAAVAGLAGASVRDNRRIRARSMAVFDQTFAITSVLRMLAGVVAFVGVLGALMALQLDRAREHAILRALGLSRRQLGALTLGQSGLLGLVAGLFAVPLGLVLAWLLVFVINRRAFGWTMDFLVRASPLLEGVALAVIAAVLAAIYPAWQAARRPPAANLREE